VRHIGLALALIPARAAQFGSIGDTVLCDFNRDGAQQTGELGLAGVKVTLTGNNMTQTAVADANGNYLFGHHEAGDLHRDGRSSQGATPAAMLFCQIVR